MTLTKGTVTLTLKINQAVVTMFQELGSLSPFLGDKYRAAGSFEPLILPCIKRVHRVAPLINSCES